MAVAVLAALVLAFAIPPDELNRYDEGLILQGAAQVLAGDVPYRDFWTIYAPGQFWALAAWFGLTEASVLAGRVWDLLMRVALVVTVFDLTLLLGCRRWAGG
ncbi:MAG: hypothetical protein U5L11_00345 [Arhodomonas sp.]|nr:hypothetical protein [Arhodomonas sp.]